MRCVPRYVTAIEGTSMLHNIRAHLRPATATLRQRSVQVTGLEAEVARLRTEAKEAAHANEVLRGKVQRSVEAVEAAAEVQGKMEGRYAKLAAKRAAEQQELQAARVKAAELQVRVDAVLGGLQ